jgi:hypothetical protein
MTAKQARAKAAQVGKMPEDGHEPEERKSKPGRLAAEKVTARTENRKTPLKTCAAAVEDYR